MAITYNNLYLDIRRLFRENAMVSPTLEAQELVCFATRKSPNELLRDGGLYVPDTLHQQTLALAQRHMDGEPVAYLIGEWEFYGLPLDISNQVLIPRPDTEVLVECALSACKQRSSVRILDLCAGSGCIGLALASQLPQSRVILGDLSEGALTICRKNTRKNDLTAQVSTLSLDALAPPPESLGTFDLLVSNPPYIPSADVATLDTSVKDFEPHMALDGGADGLDFYRNITQQWKKALRPGGALVFEVGIHQSQDVADLLRLEGFSHVIITNDLGGIPRVVQGVLAP